MASSNPRYIPHADIGERLRILDDEVLTFGDDDDFKIKYDTGDGRLEILDASDNVLIHITDDGSAGTLDVSSPITGDLTNNGGAGSEEAVSAGIGTGLTVTGLTNVTSADCDQYFWQRVGGIVTLFAQINVTPTAASNTLTAVRFELPISSDFNGDPDDAIGLGIARDTSNNAMVLARCESIPADDEIRMRFHAPVTSELTFAVTVGYRID